MSTFLSGDAGASSTTGLAARSGLGNRGGGESADCRPVGCPWTGGARREEEAQPEAADEAAKATALRTRTVRLRLEQ